MAEEHQHKSGGGGGFLSKLRGQAETLMSNIPAYNEMEHTLRQARVSANPRQSQHTLKIQLAVKGAKGVIIDHDAVARETKSYSKNILDLVRMEAPVANHDTADIQDIGDRLAFLTYKAGELHSEHAKKLEEARLALKEIRNYEDTLKPSRDARSNIEKELGKLRTNTKPDTHILKRIEELQSELNKYTSPSPDSQLAVEEVNALRLKRTKIAESFNIQFDALQELGEKLAIIAVHGKALLAGYDTSSEQLGKTDYIDGARTAQARSGVESALSTWSASKPHVPVPTFSSSSSSTSSGQTGTGTGAGIGAATSGIGSKSNYAPSFHDTHGSELASLHSVDDPVEAHKQALDSYYNAPSSPTPVTTANTTSHHHSTSGVGVGIPGSGTGSGSSSSAGHTVQSASPFVQQLNNAPVTSLPGTSVPSSSASGIGGADQGLRDPNTGLASSPAGHHSGGTIEGHQRMGLGSTGTSAHAPPPSSSSYGSSPGLVASDPASASLAPAASLPTVAETGAPIQGTGGPSSGVLGKPSTSSSFSSSRSKEEEAREDTNRRFEEYSGHAGAGAGGYAGAETSGQGAGAGADLDREMSVRGKQAGETLPAYSADGQSAPRQ